MARRRKASVQLVHANPGQEAKLVHASTGQAAPLAGPATIHGTNLMQVSAPRGGGGGGRGGVSSPGGFKDEKDPSAPKPVAQLADRAAAGSGWRSGHKGRVETVASIGNRRFNASQVKSAIDRGLKGQRLGRDDQAIFDAYNKRQQDAKAAADAKAAEEQRQKERKEKLDDQIALQNNQAKNQEAAAVAADKRKQEAAEEAAQEARRQAEFKKYNEDKAWLKLNGFDAEALGIENLFSTPLTEDYKKKLLADRENDAWNEAHGVDKGTRLTANEKKNIEDGTHVWGYSQKDQQAIQNAQDDFDADVREGLYDSKGLYRKDGKGNLVKIGNAAAYPGETVKTEQDWMKDALDEEIGKYRKGVQQKPVDPREPNIRTIDGIRVVQNGNTWTPVSSLQPKPEVEKPETVNGMTFKDFLGMYPKTRREVVNGIETDVPVDPNEMFSTAQKDWDRLVHPEKYNKLSPLEKAVLGVETSPTAPSTTAPTPAKTTTAPSTTASVTTYRGTNFMEPRE